MMKHCPVCGVNIGRFILSIVAGFIFLFGLDYLIHHVMLMDIYNQTPDLWRSNEAMADFFPLMIVRTVLLVGILAFIFTRNFEEKGIKEGVRFGLTMGVLLALLMASSYIWMPISLELAIGWAASGLFTGLGLGIIFSLTYKK